MNLQNLNLLHKASTNYTSHTVARSKQHQRRTDITSANLCIMW